jgi:hypothetical protein
VPPVHVQAPRSARPPVQVLVVAPLYSIRDCRFICLNRARSFNQPV